MSFDTNVSAPAESPEQKAARERAEAQAKAKNTRALQLDLTQRTRELLRLFGLNSALGGQSTTPTAGFGQSVAGGTFPTSSGGSGGGSIGSGIGAGSGGVSNGGFAQFAQ